MDASELLSGIAVVPVVVIDDASIAVDLATTLREAGLPAIEVTLRTDSALEAIAEIARAVPDVIVGAGSVRRAEQVAQIADAGARFAVSPGASEQLLDAAHSAALPFVPGAFTPSDVVRLLERGYVLQKFFPAELAGGRAMLQAIGAPLPEARFFPTGGITADTAAAYLALENVQCIGGSWIAPAALLKARDLTAIGKLALAAAALGT